MLKDAFSDLGYIPIAALCVGLLAAYQIATPNSALTQQAAECVVETLNAQEAASRDEFIRAWSGVPVDQVLQIFQIARQSENPERAEGARQANLRRIEELCRLKFP
jgi:hypothetical protein